ncbi:MAG: SRPBCC family protein [Thermoproteota archaeon]|jgi:carbon monoxide dehydrogenase subunit G|nr:SRPBCC family protein [Thermoproteota archaeon]
MVNFHTSKEIKAPSSKVWEIISDLDREPEFWHGTKSIKNINKSDNTVEREVIIAFKNSLCKETVSLEPMKSITTNIIEGPIKGKKVIVIHAEGEDKTVIDVEWDIKVSGFMRLFSGMVKKHISEGTEAALDRISRAV